MNMNMNIKAFIIIVFSLLVVACSTKQYHAAGQYTDATGADRKIILQWKSQEYYFPLVEAEVDYGSVSLQAECLNNVLLDYENHAQYGLVFKERVQDFQLVENAPIIKIGNYIVCAKLKKGMQLKDMLLGDAVILDVYCESKFSDTPSLQANLNGYHLVIKEGETKKQESLDCPVPGVPVLSDAIP